MKSISHIYENILDDDNIIRTMYKSMAGKKKSKSVRRFLSPENINRNDAAIKRGIIDGTLPAQSARIPKIIHEPSAGKDRIIYPSHDNEHVVHHLVCQELEQMFMRGMYDFCVASVPHRGDSYGKKYMKKWIKRAHGRKMYVLKLDIHHFFDTIDRNILFEKLSSRIHDVRFVEIMRKIIWYDNDPNGKGIPIGFYTSQWFANFYLQDFDYFVKQCVHAKYYMRYMDDIVILDANKRKLWRIYHEISAYLSDKLRLDLNDNRQLFRFSYFDRRTRKEKGRAIDFMGYVFHYNRTCMRKNTLRRTRRKANKIATHRRPTWFESAQMVSRAGRMRHTNTHKFFARWIMAKVRMRKLRMVISNYAKSKVQAERTECYAGTCI